MADELRNFIKSQPELFKTAMRMPSITQKALTMVTGIQKWAERAGIKQAKNIRITGPSKAKEPYDVVFRITRKGG